MRTGTRRFGRRLLLAPALLALVAGLTGCSMGGGSSQRSATAYFSDVGDLANGAQVQLADVPVGSVSNIALDGSKAKITLTFDNNVRIPADVSAAVARTTILGDQFVQLNVPKGEIGPGAAGAPQLADGAVIKKTSTAADVEQLVQAGASVFGAVSTTELEQIIQAGGQGFTGQAASLKAFLENLDAVATTYSQHTGEITSAVNGLNNLTSTLAPASGTTATALDNLSKTVQILAQNSQQFENVLQSLDNLSTQGRSLLETYYPQIVTQLKTLQAISGQVAQHQSDLAALLSAIPVANANLPNAVRNGYVQLYENIIVCGIPGLGQNNAQPAFSCAKTGGTGS
ncbi:MAG TPA: MCE family protein [Acidimicrobiales bacterium]|jgi:phospholipid/cholesterol/gamma-HCH transport system substrate-binding protein